MGGIRMFYITFRSITYAQRAQNLLDRRGIRTYLLRTPKAMAKNGCGYSLRTAYAEAVNYLQEANLPYQRLWTVENGQPEEVAP